MIQRRRNPAVDNGNYDHLQESSDNNEATGNVEKKQRHAPTGYPSSILWFCVLALAASSFSFVCFVPLPPTPGGLRVSSKRSLAHVDKERLLKILKEAQVGSVSDELLAELPTWSTVTSLYGSGPQIVGIPNHCHKFQETVDRSEGYIGIAGSFNTGTNLMDQLLSANCFIPQVMQKYGKDDTGMEHQVPWGKHNPPYNETYRQTHKAIRGYASYNVDWVLPVVMVRDPYYWMSSMCRRYYAADWQGTDKHCPSLLPNNNDIKAFPNLTRHRSVPITVRYNGFTEVYDSLVHMWNHYNGWYYRNATFPRIMVRMEDLTFYPKETTAAVCHCVGGQMKPTFSYVVSSSKQEHYAPPEDDWNWVPNVTITATKSNMTGLVDGMIMFSNHTKFRYLGYEPRDLRFAERFLDQELMDMFGYKQQTG